MNPKFTMPNIESAIDNPRYTDAAFSESKKIKPVVKLLKHQYKFVNSNKPFIALTGGFGAGKTESMINRCFHLIYKNYRFFKDSNGIYNIGIYEPTNDLIETIVIPRIEMHLQKFGIKYFLNKSQKRFFLDDLATVIHMKTMSHPERIIGYETADSLIDELDTLSKEKAKDVWGRIASRNRAKKPSGEKNTTAITTTPEGHRFTYSFFIEEIEEEKDPKKKKKKIETREIIKAKTWDNPYIDDEYIENIKATHPAHICKAYLEGEFVNMVNATIYRDFDKEKNATTREITKNDRIIHIGIDFNVDNMSAAVAIKIKDTLHFVDEITDANDTPHLITIIKERYPDKIIYVYPDSSGGARKTVDASKTDIKLLRNAGFTVIASSKNPPVKDRILTLNVNICNAKGERRVFVNDRNCPEIIKCLSNQTYDKNGNPDKKSGYDHMPDAVGYVVYRLLRVAKKKDITFNTKNIFRR